MADAEKELARSKIADPRRRSDFLAARAREGVEKIVPPHESWRSAWQFERNGSATAAWGGYQSGGLLMTFRYYFDGSLGAVVNESATHKSGRATPIPASIWECSGPCIRRRPTGEQGLALGPEDFALLSGLDVLRIYDAAWTLRKVTAADVVLGATTRATPKTNQQLTLVLDASAHGAPSEIFVDRGGWNSRLRVLRRREFAGGPIPSVVERVVRWPGGTVQRLVWTLRGISDAGATRLAIPRNHLVSDTRLLGRDLSVGQVLNAEELHDARVVLYKWPGTLPSREELPEIRDRELARRGGLTYRNSPALLLWLAGAWLVAVGIVWRQRNRRRRRDAAGDSPALMR